MLMPINGAYQTHYLNKSEKINNQNVKKNRNH